MLFASAVLAAPPEVPPGNRDKGAPPGIASAEEGARLLLAAVAADDPALGRGFFFPAEAFDLVKDMAAPGNYHRKLVRWYEEDIRALHRRFASGDWKVQGVALGRCKWKEAGREANKLPYWSCRRSTVTAADGARTRRFDIEVLINWGDRWYVTHLGPVRK